VVPAEESASQNLALAAVVGLIGLLVVGAVAMLAWRRRTEPLQEK
jgi:HAMP domain-containing protein